MAGETLAFFRGVGPDDADWSAQVQRARQVVAENAPIIQAQLSQAKAAVAEAAANAAAALEAKAKAAQPEVPEVQPEPEASSASSFQPKTLKADNAAMNEAPQLVAAPEGVVVLHGFQIVLKLQSVRSRFILGVWGLRVCSPAVAQPSAIVRNRPQPFATVRNRSQPFATVRNRSRGDAMAVLATVRNRSPPFATVRNRSREDAMAVPMGDAAKEVIFGRFRRIETSFRVVGVALRDIPMWFKMCRSLFVWQTQYFRDVFKS
eukprot:s1518_g7.t1